MGQKKSVKPAAEFGPSFDVAKPEANFSPVPFIDLDRFSYIMFMP